MTIDKTMLQEQVAAVATRVRSSLPPEKQLIPRRPRTGTIFTSLPQERLWFLDQLEVEKAPFNACGAFRLTGKLNRDALSRSLKKVMERHEVLRTTFARGSGQPEQNILARLDMELPLVINMTDCPRGERTQKALEIAQNEAKSPFDLEFGPLFYAKLLVFADDEAVLLLNGHQTVFDAASVTVVMKEVIALYNAIAKGETPALAEPSIQYRDYASWQRQLVQDGTFNSQIKFWKDTLSDASSVLELPADHPRPATQTLKGEAVSFNVPEALAKQLYAFSQQNNLNLSTVLLTAFYTLLFRYTGREDILVGCPVANRHIAETQSMVGLFTNLLVARGDLTGAPSFRDLATRVDNALKKALANQELPFEKLLEELKVSRDLSRAPLVQTSFDFEDGSAALPEMVGLQLERLKVENWLAGFDISLNMQLDSTGLQGAILYASDLFKADSINRLVGHYLTLLEGAMADASQPIHKLPLLTSAERQMMLFDWNKTETPFDKVAPVYQLFEDQAVRRPDAIAAIYDDEHITYQELNRRANRLAHFLVEAGVVPDMIVALLAERSIDYLTAILAIHKAGGAFLPMDPRHPAPRLAQILQQSESPLVLISKDYQTVLNEAVAAMSADKTAPRVAQIKEVLQEQRPEENLPIRCQMNSLAYVMFTSGSTGLPKGVMVEHLGMLNHNWAKISDLHMNENDTLAQIGPQSFDIMVWQFVAPLIIGAKVHIFRDEIAYNPVQLMEHLPKAKISVLQLVPAFLNTMVQEAKATGTKPDLSALRWVVPTGEALPTELCRQWLELYPAIPLLNTYGSTECSDDQCHYPIHQSPPADYPMPIMTIGTPIRNMGMYILDQWLQPVPIGAIGELYVGGIGVGRGYLKDAERTAKAFISNPYSETLGARLYKTGDQGRYMPDGTIEFLGRVDHMVKVRGFRIELGEIESVLSQHPAIKHVIVIVREDVPNNKYIAAYYVTDPQQVPSVSDLRDYVGSKLPDYMIPTAFVKMDVLPLTANGKIDRKNLPAPDLEKIRAESFVAPSTPTEQFLADVWAEMLNLKQVGINDNFFELGGHSLLAIRIFSRIDKKFNKQLPLGTLFRAPTIKQLALVLDEDDESSELWTPLVAIQPEGEKPPFFVVGGGILHMRNLSYHLGKEQPFYALQTETIEGEQLLQAQLDVIATELLKEVRKQQPHGPYYLGGCYGSAMVALEMANQLTREGEEVATLVAFNTLPKRTKRSLMHRVVRRLKQTLSLNPMKMVRRVQDAWADVDWLHFREALMSIFWKVSYRFFKLIHRPMPRFLRTGIYAEMLLRQASETYVPTTRYSGKVVLILTTEWYNKSEHIPMRGWGKYIGGELEVHVSPGDPCTMFTEPNVYVMSQAVKISLDRAQKAQATFEAQASKDMISVEEPVALAVTK